MDKFAVVEQSQRHLALSRMTWSQHFWHAFSLGWILIANGLSSIIHAFIPALFPGTAAKTTMRIFYKVCYAHPNPHFQTYRLACKDRYAAAPASHAVSPAAGDEISAA